MKALVLAVAANTMPDPITWQSDASAGIPTKPPYLVDMKVTPLSRYSDDEWVFPSNWVTINNRERATLRFHGGSRFRDGVRHLDPVEDSVLLGQLREAVVGNLYRRDVIASLNKRTRYISGSGAFAILQKLRRIFVAFKICGCRSLSDVTPEVLSQTLDVLGGGKVAFEDLAIWLPNLLALSKHGLITNGIRSHDFELIAPIAGVVDSTAAIGWQPFADEDVANLIHISNRYIDLAGDIVERLHDLQAGRIAAKDLVDWAAESLPCGKSIAMQNDKFIVSRLVKLVHAACNNLICFHLGLRACETLSLLSDFISVSEGAVVDVDRLGGEFRLRFTTFKTVPSHAGRSRQLSCHPRLLRVSEVLNSLKKATGSTGDYVFVPFGETLPYVTKRWNDALQLFCNLHGLRIDMASHRWRKTVAAIAVRVLTGAALHLKELFGHDSLAMTARYIMASPFIRDELRDLTLDEYRKRGRTLLESLVATGGSGLGGRYGKDLEERFSKFVDDADITEHDLGKTLDEWLEEMLRVGIYPVPVMDGVFCLKPVAARGECASSSGDRMADPARCTARCSFQVQQAHRRDLVAWTVRRISQKWSTWSALEQRYWAAQCRDQMVAWPELVEQLHVEIESWPILKIAMEEKLNGKAA